jgi:hypothetical protein
MGQAKQRGKYEERKAQAIERDKDKPKKQPKQTEIISGPSLSPLKLDNMLGMFGLSRWHRRKK